MKQARPTITREEPEPTAGTATTPLWLTGLMAVLVYWSCYYTDEYGGNFNALVYEPYYSTNQLDEFRPKSDADVLIARGKALYRQNCAPCHQESGTGNPATFVPPLAGSEWVLTPGAGRSIRIVLHGLTGPIKVKGMDFGNAAMLPWRDIMSDADIAAVLTYVRNEWGNKAPAVTAEQVKTVRAAEQERSDNWTAAELLKVPESE